MPFPIRKIVWVLGLYAAMPAAGITLPAVASSDWFALHQLGSQAYGIENYALAEQYFAQALNAAEQGNIRDARLLATLNNLASTYTQLGKLERASEVFERLEPFRTPPVDRDTARALIESDVNHAAFLFRRGRPMEAQKEFEHSLERAEQALGADDPVVAQICNHLAMIYKDAAQYGRARQCAERAIAIREKTFGPNALQTAASISALSQVVHAEGNLAEAEALCRRVLAIRRDAGPNLPRVAESLSNLGTVLKSAGNYAGAEPLYLEAQRIWVQAKGPASFEAALVMNNLASLYEAQGKRRKAEDRFRQAARAMEQAVGPDNPALALVLANFSTLYREWCKWDRAEALLQRAEEIDEKALGPSHPHVALDLTAGAQVAVARKDYARAEALMLRALAIHRSTAGPESRPAAEAAFQVAMVDQLWGKPGQAAPYFAQAMKIWKVDAGSDLEVARALEAYAAALKSNRQFAEAEEAVTAAVGIRVQAARKGTPKAFPRG
jgi:tetratricopeptide (TPR) repeat protein